MREFVFVDLDEAKVRGGADVARLLGPVNFWRGRACPKCRTGVDERTQCEMTASPYVWILHCAHCGHQVARSML